MTTAETVTVTAAAPPVHMDSTSVQHTYSADAPWPAGNGPAATRGPARSKARPSGGKSSGSGVGSGSGSGVGSGRGAQATPAPTPAPDPKAAEAAARAQAEAEARARLFAKLHPALQALLARLERKEAQPDAAEAKFVRDGKAELRVWLTDKTPELLAQLKQLGFEIVLEPQTAKLLIGRLPVDKLAALAALKEVRFVAPDGR